MKFTPLQFCDLKGFDGFEKSEFLEPYHWDKEERLIFWDRLQDFRKNGTGEMYAIHVPQNFHPHNTVVVRKRQKSVFIGVCHWYFVGKNRYIGIALLSIYRNCGLGSKAMEFLLKKGDFALIIPDNSISKSFAEKHGFSRTKETFNEYEIWEQ